MKKLLISSINFYQIFLSFDHGILSVFAPGGACKYSPTCSQYTKQMIENHGVAKGVWRGFKRLWGCR